MTRKKKMSRKKKTKTQQPLRPAATSSTTNDAIVITPLGDYTCDEVRLEILSRLPAKSLMRFKCVCKSWLYLIQEDEHFISLHCSRSKSNKKLLIGSSCECRGTSFFALDFLEKSTVYMTRSPLQSENEHILSSGYGLLSFMWEHAFKIYNLFTREETPWTKSEFGKKKHEYQSLLFGFGFDPVTGFGFDHVTEKHKVLIMWTTYDPNLSEEREQVPFCEVFTVGENTWRTIDSVPPMKPLYGKPTYANGSLYWSVTSSSRSGSIIEFDVGKEKFRLIKYPGTIRNGPLLRSRCEFHDLLEVDGHLGLIEKRFHHYEKENLKKMKMWILNEDENESKKSSRWIEETLELPFDVTWSESFKSIPGTNMIMVTTNRYYRGPFIYVYDRKKKELNEYSSLAELGGNKGNKKYFRYPYYCELTNIVETIYPVRTPTN